MRHSLLPFVAIPLSVVLCSCGFMTPAQQYACDRKGASVLSKPTFRPTLDISLKAGYFYTVNCDASEGKATAFLSQETRQLQPSAARSL